MKKLTKDKFFPERLRILIKDYLKIRQIEFCDNVGITQGYLSMVLSGKRGPSAELIAGIFFNYSKYLEWLLTGDSTKLESGNYETNKTVIEHQTVIKRFKDPKRGLSINEKLIDIQDASEDLFDKVESYIDGVHDASKIIKTQTQPVKNSEIIIAKKPKKKPAQNGEVR